jgi:hypothetical protein
LPVAIVDVALVVGMLLLLLMMLLCLMLQQIQTDPGTHELLLPHALALWSEA